MYRCLNQIVFASFVHSKLPYYYSTPLKATVMTQVTVLACQDSKVLLTITG